MKQENKIRNKLSASLMCLVMIGATLFGTPWFSVRADETITTKTGGQSLGAYEDALVENGSFEAGYVGREVYGWHMTAMTQGHGIATDTNYLKAYTLKTVKEADGNKVAALTKNGPGYIAATSEEIKVNASTEYRVSFDYKILDMFLPEGVAVSNFNGVRLYVVELDANGNVVTNKGISAATMHYKDVTYAFDTLRSGMGVFTTSSTTDKVVIYLYTGATNANISFTIHFDNVVLEETPKDYEVLNGTFDYLTHKADGGRAVAESERSEMGPAGWGMYDNAGNHYKVTTVEDVTRGKVACMTFADNDTSGGNTTWLSPYIPMVGQKDLTVAFDYHLIMNKFGGASTTVDPSLTIRIFQYNSSKSFKGADAMSPVIKTATTDWTKGIATVTGTSLDASTAYIRIGFYVSFTSAEVSALEEFELYLDNVVIDVTDESLGYTKSTAKSNCVPNTGDYTNNYAIRKVNAEVGYEDAIQLYVTREGGGQGGAAFWSKPLSVASEQTYKIQFDWKVEGVAEASRNLGAAVALRYKDANGNYLNANSPAKVLYSGISSNTVDSTGNTIWKTCAVDNLVVPEGAVAVEMGFLIGVTTQNYNPDMKNTFANIGFALANDTKYWAGYEADKNTDLFLKLTERGNAYIDDTSIDVLDLVMMKKYAADNTLITDEVLGNADMNVNTLINNADIELLHWKLLGADTEAKAAQVQGYQFY